jgi:molybdopterin-guanine dinucleotide biosynthesis protein
MNNSDRPRIIAVAGTSSEVGKTTLLCRLLRELSGAGSWEAIKLTRGHYRSCGKDPHACCVSHLLGGEPTIRSGRQETDAAGKDTARYWEAGASNVHWVIVTNDQVEQGIKLALERVQSRLVLIEGTSFLKFMRADFAVLVTRADPGQLKPSARFALSNGLIDAIYLPDHQQADHQQADHQQADHQQADHQQADHQQADDQQGEEVSARFGLPLYTHYDFPQLVSRISQAVNE